MRGSMHQDNMHQDDECPLLDNHANEGPCNLTPDNICDGDNSANVHESVPQGNQTCVCSNIAYVLAAACNSCLNEGDLSWTDYSSDRSNGCSNFTLPQPFPSSLLSQDIPSWAFAMVSATPTPTSFDAQAATSLASSIQSATAFPSTPANTSTNAPLSSTSTATPSTSATLSTQAATGSQTPIAPLTAASQKTSHAGAIAGGLIGALVFLALIGAGILYIRRRRRRLHIAPSAAYLAALRTGEQPYHPVHRESMDEMRTVSVERDGSPGPWPSSDSERPASSRFLEHT